MNKSYKWARDAKTAGVPADIAAAELERIQKEYGSITTENVLDASKRKSAILHNYFNWDDTQAAHLYRLNQAKRLINDIEVIVISEGKEISVPVFEVVSRTDDGKNRGIFKQFDVMTYDELEVVKRDVIALLNRAKEKLRFYTEYEDIAKVLDRATKRLSKTKNLAKAGNAATAGLGR